MSLRVPDGGYQTNTVPTGSAKNFLEHDIQRGQVECWSGLQRWSKSWVERQNFGGMQNLPVWIFANHWSWSGSDTCHYRAPQKRPEEHDLCFRWPFLAWGCSSCAYETSLSSENQHFGVYPWASQHNDGKWPHLLVRWCTYEEFVIFHGYVKLPEGIIMGF